MKQYLNKNEEQVLHILWNLKKAFLKEIMEELDAPRPPVTTVASLIKKMEKRGLVGHKTFGKTHQYFPILAQSDYKQSELKSLVQNYFGGSPAALVSFFMKEEKMDISELENIFNQIKENEDDA